MPSGSLKETLEAALVENPEDLATHMAYADYLMDQGDPRGEFIQVQLALEDPNRPEAERQQLQHREKELLDQHVREWLGDLAESLLDGYGTPGGYAMPDSETHFRFARGWL